MVWVRLDDRLTDHVKWHALSPAARLLLIELLIWTSKEQTGGFIPHGTARRYAGRGAARRMAELANAGQAVGKAGFVEPVEAGWQIHDFKVYQPSSDAVTEAVIKRSERARRANAARWHGATTGSLRHPKDSNKDSLGEVKDSLEPPSDILGVSPDPDPDLTLAKAAASDPKDLTGSSREAAAVAEGWQVPPAFPIPVMLAGKKDAEWALEEDEIAPPLAPKEPDKPRPTPRLSSKSAALAVPITERARHVLEHEHEADWTQPEQWPEVLGLVAAFGAATGQSALRLGSYSRDAGVRSLVALYAAGYTQAELERAVKAAVKDPWWNADGKRRGLASLSPEVVRRLLIEEPATARRRPRVETTGKPLPKGAACLPPVETARLIDGFLATVLVRGSPRVERDGDADGVGAADTGPPGPEENPGPALEDGNTGERARSTAPDAIGDQFEAHHESRLGTARSASFGHAQHLAFAG